jgi:hypothetical protein
VLVVGLDLVGMLNRHLLLWISFVWRFTKTTVQLSNIDAGAGGISLTANDKHSNDKHVDNSLTNQPSNNPANQSDNNPPNHTSARLTFTFLCLE